MKRKKERKYFLSFMFIIINALVCVCARVLMKKNMYFKLIVSECIILENINSNHKFIQANKQVLLLFRLS